MILARQKQNKWNSILLIAGFNRGIYLLTIIAHFLTKSICFNNLVLKILSTLSPPTPPHPLYRYIVSVARYKETITRKRSMVFIIVRFNNSTIVIIIVRQLSSPVRSGAPRTITRISPKQALLESKYIAFIHFNSNQLSTQSDRSVLINKLEVNPSLHFTPRILLPVRVNRFLACLQRVCIVRCLILSDCVSTLESIGNGYTARSSQGYNVQFSILHEPDRLLCKMYEPLSPFQYIYIYIHNIHTKS